MKHEGTCPGCHHSINDHLKVASPEIDLQVFGEACGDTEFACFHMDQFSGMQVICACILVIRIPVAA